MHRIVLVVVMATGLLPGTAAALGPAPSWQLTQGVAGSCTGSTSISLSGVEINIPTGQASERGLLSAPGFPELGYTQDSAFGPFVGTVGFTAFLNGPYTLPANTPITLQVATYFGTNLTGGVAYVSRLTWDCTTGVVIPETGACSGFTDVDVGNAFCPSVQWMKNRGITTGCTATAYCPNDPVTRLQMAAFMYRLGAALQPAFVHRAQAAVQAVVNANGVVCQTPAHAVTGHPRAAAPASVAFRHAAPGAVLVSTQLVYSLDNGATWPTLGSVLSATNVAAGAAAQSPGAASRTFWPGQSVRFGIKTTAASATVGDASCELTMRLDTTTGPFTPYDAGVQDDQAARSTAE